MRAVHLTVIATLLSLLLSSAAMAQSVVRANEPPGTGPAVETPTPVPTPAPSVSRQEGGHAVDESKIIIPTEPEFISIAGSGNMASKFVFANLYNMSRAYIKLTGVDLADDKLIDDFAIINNCDMYLKFYKDEFNWRQAREAFRKVIQRDLEGYPEHIYLLGNSRLGRYDFDRKAFIFDEKYTFQRTGLLPAPTRVKCGALQIDRIPLNYTFRLTNPITLDAIPLEENKARILTRMMEQSNNQQRKIYVAFFVRINDFSTIGSATSGMGQNEATVRATMVSMRFYLDPERKTMIYEYTGPQ